MIDYYRQLIEGVILNDEKNSKNQNINDFIHAILWAIRM